MKSAQPAATANDMQIRVLPTGAVIIFGNENVKKRPATAEGVTFETSDNGRLIVYTDGDVTVVPSDWLAMPGQQMTDGTYYLGRFQDERGTEQDYFAAAEDEKSNKGERLLLNFRQAAAQARKSKAHGYKDWEVPESGTLNAIFNNKADIAGLELNSADPFLGYRSSERSDAYPGYAKVQRMADGAGFNDHTSRKLPVRLVRGVAL